MFYCNVAFTVLLLAIAIIDIRSRQIPNKLLLIGIIVTLPSIFLLGSFLSGVIGGCVGFVLFGILYLVAPDKVGAGDVKLACLIGLMVGFPLVLLSLSLAILIGGVISWALVAFKRVRVSGNIPFAPFLCSGAIVSLWAGDWIINWYQGLF